MSAARPWTPSPASSPSVAPTTAETSVSRRGALGLAVGAAALGAGLGAAPANASTDWPIWWSWKFEPQPTLEGCGLQFLRTLPAVAFWPKGADRGVPDLEYVRTRTVAQIQEEGHKQIVLNIEHWKRNEEIVNYIKISETVKKALPDVRIGWYSIVPNREYYALQEDQGAELEAWRAKNADLKSLADAVDDIYPSLYAFFDDVEGWKRYGTKMIEAAKSYGKPTYPFLWMQYHDSNDRYGRSLIDGAFWRTQLDLVRAQADGLVIWGTLGLNGARRLAWDQKAPWWIATKEFAKAQGHSVDACQDAV